MSDTPYDRVKGGRLTFKGGLLASRSKDIEKKKKRKKKNKDKEEAEQADILNGEQADILNGEQQATASGSGEAIYTIDAAKKMKYEDLFPVETKKFGYDYDPKVKTKSVEEALDDRVKKKADRYCK